MALDPVLLAYFSLQVLTRAGDYCDVYLTHDSMSVRKAHNAGRNHLRNVVDYYQRKSRRTASPSQLRYSSDAAAEIGHEKAQSVIDSITNSYAAEGQAGANPMLQQPFAGPYPPPFGAFPGWYTSCSQRDRDLTSAGSVPPPFPVPGAPGAPPGMMPREYTIASAREHIY